MIQRVKQIKDVEIVYDAPAGFSLLLSTDMPGTAIALRRTVVFPASAGRRTFVAPLVDDAGNFLEGTLYMPKFTSTGVVRLFGGFLRVRGIGVYFDGAQGETWETQPQSLL